MNAAARAIMLVLSMSILAVGCTSRPYQGPVAKMPPCDGVWLSTNGGESYLCISDEEFERWRQRNGL